MVDVRVAVETDLRIHVVAYCIFTPTIMNANNNNIDNKKKKICLKSGLWEIFDVGKIYLVIHSFSLIFETIGP